MFLCASGDAWVSVFLCMPFLFVCSIDYTRGHTRIRARASVLPGLIFITFGFYKLFHFLPEKERYFCERNCTNSTRISFTLFNFVCIINKSKLTFLSRSELSVACTQSRAIEISTR